jgi:hypothetical protein
MTKFAKYRVLSLTIGMAILFATAFIPAAPADDSSSTPPSDMSRMIGTWHTIMLPNNTPVLVLWSIQSDGYTMTVPLPTHTITVGAGTLLARDGTLHLIANSGPSVNGTYHFTDDNTLVMKDDQGTVAIWTRGSTTSDPAVAGQQVDKLGPEVDLQNVAPMQVVSAARLFAKQWQNDAVLISITVTQSQADGHVDLTANPLAISCDFYSPSTGTRLAACTDRPTGTITFAPCLSDKTLPIPENTIDLPEAVIDLARQGDPMPVNRAELTSWQRSGGGKAIEIWSLHGPTDDDRLGYPQICSETGRRIHR